MTIFFAPPLEHQRHMVEALLSALVRPMIPPDLAARLLAGSDPAEALRRLRGRA